MDATISYDKKLIVNLIELGLVMLVAFFILWQTREKYLIVDDDYLGYVTIVYNVKGEKPLYKSLIAWRYEVEIPNDGILFTSTPEYRDLPITSFKTKSGNQI